jgi:hypothetical protein
MNNNTRANKPIRCDKCDYETHEYEEFAAHVAQHKEPLEIIATETNNVLSDDFESMMDPHFCSDYVSAHQRRKKTSKKQPAKREPNQVPQNKDTNEKH